MYLNFIKYFLFFIFLTLHLNASAQINDEKPSEKEEIKDTIVVHGMVLHGKITRIGPERLSFQLLYSEGQSHFAYRDIDSIKTKYTYRISHNRMDIEGRIIGIEDKKYLKVVEKDDNLRTVKIADIDNFVMSVNDDDSFENRVRNRIPYTKGNIHMGFELEDGSSKKRKTDILFNLKHEKAEHETQLYVDYEFDRTKTGDNPEVQNKDELTGILTYKNNYKNDQFVFAALYADYDRPRYVQSRYIPSVGYGYRFSFDKSKWLEPAIGVGYARTRYVDDLYQKNDFSVASFKLSGNYRVDDVMLINTLIVDGFVLYFPSLENYDEDWVLRSNLNFTVPLFDFFSVKLKIDYINNSNPDPSVGNNKTTTKLLFGLDF